MSIKQLSTGHPSTLGSYFDLCAACGMKKAAEHFKKKIAESPNGRDEKVLADESQMMFLIVAMSTAERLE